MSNRDPDATYEDIHQCTSFQFEQFIKTKHTSIPGEIREYDSSTKRASVQPLNLLLTDGTSIPRATYVDVPVIQPSAGGWVFNLPVQPGDAVMVLFSERGIENFKNTFKVADLPDDIVMAERDAVALLGFGALNISPVTDQGISIQSEDGSVYMTLENNAVTVKSRKIVWDGDVNVTGEMEVGKSLEVKGSELKHQGKDVGKTHTHIGTMSGGSKSGPPG